MIVAFPRPGLGESEPRASSDEQPAANLATLRGKGTGTHDVLGRECATIGRDRGCDVALSDATVSCRHAEIHRDDHVYTLIDTGSLTGIYHNRHLTREAELADGDGIWIGKARFVVRLAPPPENTHQDS